MTTVVLRPTGRVSASGLTDNSATMWQRLDDDPPDTTSPGSVVSASGSAKAIAVLDMDTFTLPAGALVSGVQVGMHAKATSARPGQGRAELRKADGTVLASLTDSQFRSTYRTAKSAVAAAVLTQADIDGLQVWFRTNAKQAGPYPVTVAEIYAWVSYVARPTVTINGAPLAVTTSTLPLGWDSVFDPDSDGVQSHYRVVVLTAAQAAVAAGDPLSVPEPVEDTGDVLSSAEAVTLLGLPALAAGVVYVRAAQLVGGVPFWSGWATTTLDVTLTVADVEDVTTATVLDQGGVTVVVSRLLESDPWVSVEVERGAWTGGLTDEDGRPLFDEDGQPLTGDDYASPFVIVWVRVPGSPVTPVSDTVTVIDYGADPNIDYVWRSRARNAAGSVGQWVYSLPGRWEHLSGQLWLKSAADPAVALKVWVVVAPLPENRGRRQTVHEIVPDGPLLSRRVVSSWPLTGRETVLDCWTETAAEAARLVQVVASGVVLVQPPADWRFMPGRFAVGGLVENVSDEVATPYAYRRWTLALTEAV